jgi:hypothetical protein
MEIIRQDHYRVSQRVTLRCGTRFRAVGGPTFRLADGTAVPLSAKGPFLFRAHCRRGEVEWIEALDREQCLVPLHIAGPRSPACLEVQARPYRITSTIRPKKQRR